MPVDWNLAVTPDPFAQVAAGRDYAKKIFDQSAVSQAGAQYAAGDLSGAANTIARRGDFENAGKLSALGTARTAGAQYVGGDPAGAVKTFAAAGNFDEAGKLQTQQVKQFQDQHNALRRAVPYLKAAKAQGKDPVAAYDAIAAKFKALDVPDADLTKIRDGLARDPENTMAVLEAMGNIDPEFKEFGGVGYVFDKNGDPTKPIAKLGDDKTYPGTSPESTDLNNLLRGVKDPAFRSTPEYAAAWNRQNAPKDQIINGKFVSIPGNVGSWAPAPGAYQGDPAPAPAASSQNEPPPPSGTPMPVAPRGATSPAAPINPAPPPLSVDDMYKAVSKRDGIPEDTLREWAKDPEDIQRLYAQPIGPAAAGPQTAPSAAGAPPQGGPAPAASAPPVPGTPNVTVADIPGLEPRGTVRDATQEELTARGFKPGVRAQINTQTGEINIKAQPTEADYKAAEYANRLTHAAESLDRLSQQGIIKPTAQVLVSDRNGVLRFAFSNQKDRQFVQAAREWLAPVVRKDSGAAVTESDYSLYEDIYIPRPEDGPEVLAQKAAARANYEDTLYGQAGPLAVQMYGQRKPRPKPSTARGPYAPGKGQPFIPKPSIDALRQHPQRAAEFDKKYGAGAAASVLGR